MSGLYLVVWPLYSISAFVWFFLHSLLNVPTAAVFLGWSGLVVNTPFMFEEIPNGLIVGSGHFPLSPNIFDHLKTRRDQIKSSIVPSCLLRPYVNIKKLNISYGSFVSFIVWLQTNWLLCAQSKWFSTAGMEELGCPAQLLGRIVEVIMTYIWNGIFKKHIGVWWSYVHKHLA